MPSANQPKFAAHLCCHFLRQFAYSNATRAVFTNIQGQLWLTMHGNFIDICVMEWCKLFGSSGNTNLYHWKNVLGNPSKFKMEMLDAHGMDDAALESLWRSIKNYRDEFVAHLETQEQTTVPNLQVAKLLVDFYYCQLVTEFPTILSDKSLPQYIDRYSDRCLDNATTSLKNNMINITN